MSTSYQGARASYAARLGVSAWVGSIKAEAGTHEQDLDIGQDRFTNTGGHMRTALDDCSITMEITNEFSCDWSTVRRECLKEARRYLRHTDDAEEAVQEALIRAWRRRSTCHNPEAPLPWMLQITRNEALRLAGRRQLRLLRELPGEDFPEPVSLGRDGDEEIDRVVGALATRQALETLREDERTLVHLRYVDDLTQPAVAERLNVPEGTVKVRLHRIRHRLRNAFEEAA